MKRILLAVVCVASLAFASTACMPTDPVLSAIASNFPASQYDKAVRVARCESGLDPTAVSPGGGNWGLFQINTVHKATVQQLGYSWSQINDPYVNARVARYIYDDAARTGSGWQPWSCRNA
jgi:soluble lytic murein transglycosylase-like protein